MWLGLTKKAMRGVAVATALVFTLGASADKLQAETLADALVGAYQNSGLLDKNRALLRAADEDVAVAMAGVAPDCRLDQLAYVFIFRCGFRQCASRRNLRIRFHHSRLGRGADAL